jgi:hypothetical protein
MKVWIVQHGEYSGRYVSGVYSSRENADIAADNDGDVSEVQIDEGIDHQASQNR